MSNAIKGLFIGCGLGVLIGLGTWTWLLSGWLLFPGDGIAAAGLLGAWLGYVLGDLFFEWIDDHWDWFV